LRLFSVGGYGLALAALALMVFGAIECPPCEPVVFANLRNLSKKSVEPFSLGSCFSAIVSILFTFSRFKPPKDTPKCHIESVFQMG